MIESERLFTEVATRALTLPSFSSSAARRIILSNALCFHRVMYDDQDFLARGPA